MQNIVNAFNADVANWRNRTGCEVIFKWVYNHNGHKILSISDITQVLYREEPKINPEELRDAIEKHSRSAK